MTRLNEEMMMMVVVVWGSVQGMCIFEGRWQFFVGYNRIKDMMKSCS